MSNHHQNCALFFCTLALALAGCAQPTAPTQEPEAIFTAAARTVEARLTLSAGETAVVMLTEIAARPTATPGIVVLPTLLPTFTPRPSATPQPTPTSPPPVTPQPEICDAAAWVADITIPENSLVAAGSTFVKTWRIRNIGGCAWTPAYALVYAGGEQMGAPSLVGIPGTVLPGESVDITVSLKAPPAQGFYENRWVLRNAANQYFEIGGQDQGSLWVRLGVIPADATGRYALDFAALACTARWNGSSGPLDCPGAGDEAAGSVRVLNTPDLETRRENEPALWLRPASSRDGWISGEYPAYRVADGDRFIAEIGCLRDHPNCSLTFRLDYRRSNGTVASLGVWDEAYDRRSTSINLDLSGLSGETVQFILTVINRGRVEDAQAFWFAPSIRNDYASSNLALTWHQEGGIRKTCDELRIYLLDNQSAEARAVSCKNGSVDVGRTSLSPQDVQQLVEWLNRLSAFDGEVFSPAGSEPLISYIVLNGRGSAEAGSTDIQNLRNFAEKIYNQITQ